MKLQDRTKLGYCLLTAIVNLKKAADTQVVCNLHEHAEAHFPFKILVQKARGQEYVETAGCHV
uniref:Uncharacterized protein n=1 Tax=Romanomermis culicivorax TaxID=13658 RepID=A0A915HVN4_ROMCU